MNFPVLTEPLPFQYSPSHSLLFPTPSTLWCTHFASFEPFGRKATAKRFFRPRRIPRVQLRPARRVGRYVGAPTVRCSPFGQVTGPRPRATAGFIKVVSWAAWTFLTLSILLELISRVRGIRVPHMPGLRLPQSAARTLVSAAMLAFIAVPMSGQGAPVAAAAPVPAAMAPAVISTPTPAGGHNQTSSTSTTGHSTSLLT